MITLFTQVLQLTESSNKPEGIAATFMDQFDDAEKFNDENGFKTEAVEKYEAVKQKLEAISRRLHFNTSKTEAEGAAEVSGQEKKSEL